MGVEYLVKLEKENDSLRKLCNSKTEKDTKSQNQIIDLKERIEVLVNQNKNQALNHDAHIATIDDLKESRDIWEIQCRKAVGKIATLTKNLKSLHVTFTAYKKMVKNQSAIIKKQRDEITALKNQIKTTIEINDWIA